MKPEDNTPPSRLDLKTRLCLTAAIIHSTAEKSSKVQDSMNTAVEIENVSDLTAKKLKRETTSTETKSNWKGSSKDIQIHPTRLDLPTRLGLMATVIYSTDDKPSVAKSIETAIAIENAADAAAKKMKLENPVPRVKRS